MLLLDNVGVEKRRKGENNSICVSLGMEEMKCELSEWNERKVQCRMTIMGRAQRNMKEKTEDGRAKHHPVPAPLAKRRP